MLDFLPVLGCALTESGANVATKQAIDLCGWGKAIVYSYLLLAVLLVLGAIALGVPLVLPPALIPLYAAQVIIGSIAVVAFFKALESGKASIISPLSSLYALVVIALGVLFFGESLSPIQLIGSLLIIVSAIVLAFENIREFRLEKGVIYMVIVVLGWGYYFAFLKPLVLAIGPYATSVFVEAGIGLLIVLFYLLSRQNLSMPSRPGILPIFWRAVLLAFTSVLYNLSIVRIGVALTSVLLTSTPIFTVVLSYFLLHEKLSIYKYAAILLLAVGLVALVAVG